MIQNIKSKILKIDELPAFRQKLQDKKIVFCTGCYDILQSGHAVFFNQCKEYGNVLVVGIGRDEVISKLKGPSRPVNPEINRMYLVAAMQDVDFALLNDTVIEEGKVDFRKVLENLKPDVFVLNDNDDAIKYKKKLCEMNNIHFQLVPRIVPPELEATSSTKIIDKIKFKYKAPLRIDLAGGWTDVPYIMHDVLGYVANITITPYIEYKEGKFNFSGYPRGSGLSTSTAAKLLEMISSKNYNIDSKSLTQVGEDLFNLENKELNWAIGRQDQYSIVFGGFNCFEFGKDYAKPINERISQTILEEFRKNLLLLHTGASRNAQVVVEEVYQNHKAEKGKNALKKLARLGREFETHIQKADYLGCAAIMEENFRTQIELAPSSSNEYLDKIYQFAKQNGMYGGKICGAGGGGAFVMYCENPGELAKKIKKEFVDCFEIDFDFNFQNIKELNLI